jgi:hypothetical protein
MNQQAINECRKVFKPLVDEVIKQYSYTMKSSTIALKIYPKLPTQNGSPALETVRTWIVKYLKEIKYYDFDAEPKAPKSAYNFIVYGIVSQGAIVYIGKTSRGFAARKEEHEKCVTGESPIPRSQFKLYEYLQKHEHSYIVMYVGQDEFDIQCTEKYLIGTLNPPLNIDGARDREYTYKLKAKDVIDYKAYIFFIIEEILKQTQDYQYLISVLSRVQTLYEELQAYDLPAGPARDIVANMLNDAIMSGKIDIDKIVKETDRYIIGMKEMKPKYKMYSADTICQSIDDAVEQNLKILEQINFEDAGSGDNPVAEE